MLPADGVPSGFGGGRRGFFAARDKLNPDQTDKEDRQGCRGGDVRRIFHRFKHDVVDCAGTGEHEFDPVDELRVRQRLCAERIVAARRQHAVDEEDVRPVDRIRPFEVLIGKQLDDDGFSLLIRNAVDVEIIERLDLVYFVEGESQSAAAGFVVCVVADPVAATLGIFLDNQHVSENGVPGRAVIGAREFRGVSVFFEVRIAADGSFGIISHSIVRAAAGVQRRDADTGIGRI
jgi:hypothetical protein